MTRDEENALIGGVGIILLIFLMVILLDWWLV